MLYYDSKIYDKVPQLLDYFRAGIEDENKNLSHCILLWGADTKTQCELALEIARLLNCKNNGDINCDCINCRWIREQTHPAVKIYTRLDFKESSVSNDEESSSSGKKNITVAQAKSIISELSVTSDYHRVYIFCDRDEDGNLLPLNMQNFPEITSNALLKTFEEPPQNTTFIILTTDKTDVISTVVSRSMSFFVPVVKNDESGYSDVNEVISQYWNIDRNDVLDFCEKLMKLCAEFEPKIVFTQIENYILSEMNANKNNKSLYYKLSKDIRYVEDAKRQVALTPAMILQTVCENLSFKLILS